MTRLRFSARTAVTVTLLTAALPLPASAQSTAAVPTRVRATINAVHSFAVDVTDTSGNEATVTLSADISVTQVAPTEPSVVRAGSYIDTAAVKEPGSTLRALEVHVFPEAAHDTGDGHRPYGLGPNGSMTSDAVEQAGAVTGAQGRTLSVKYKDGEQRTAAPLQALVVTFEPGRRDDLKAGAYVMMFVRADTQGTLIAQRVLVGKDGMVPPI